MIGLIHWILSFLIAFSMQMSMHDATEVSPQQEAKACMNAISSTRTEELDRYAGNSYVNFIDNLEGDEETVQRMRRALFANFSYEVEAVAERNGQAVARISIDQCDFSDVLDQYDRKSYQYITEHLYDEDISDKKKLNARCLDIYVSQIEKIAKAGKTHKETIYLPMVSDGYNGWNAILEEDTMKTILGDLAIPEMQ